MKIHHCATYSLTQRKFDSIESAEQAKLHLNGQDIYPGCCTVKAEYSRVRSLWLLTVFSKVLKIFT